MTPFLGLDPVFPPLGAASPRDQASWPDSKVPFYMQLYVLLIVIKFMAKLFIFEVSKPLFSGGVQLGRARIQLLGGGTIQQARRQATHARGRTGCSDLLTIISRTG